MDSSGQNGKGKAPMKGYNQKAYVSNYGNIDWGRGKSNASTETNPSRTTPKEEGSFKPNGR